MELEEPLHFRRLAYFEPSTNVYGVSIKLKQLVEILRFVIRPLG